MDAIQYGCPPRNVICTGIPVRPDLTEIRTEKSKLRSLYGLDPNLPLILAVGSKRVTSIMDYLIWGGFPKRFEFNTQLAQEKYLLDLNN